MSLSSESQNEVASDLPVVRLEGKSRRATVRLKIERLAGGGKGVGYALLSGERRAVFVPRTAPGDLVDAIVDFAQHPARGDLQAIVEPSPNRSEPPCAIWGRCSGCDWMHLARHLQLEAHAELVRSALERVKIAPPEVRSHAAPRTERYRTRARLGVQAAGQEACLGYRREASHHLLPVRSCIILDERLDAVLEPISNLFQGERGRGEVAVAVGTQGKPVLDIAWEGSFTGRFFRSLDEGCTSGRWAGAAVRLEGARRPAVVGDPRVVTAAADGGPLLTPSAGFAQANPAMSIELAARALALVPPEGAGVLELFSGSGNLTVAIAKTTSSLTAVEFAGEAVECARSNLRERGLSARLVQADAQTFPVSDATGVVWLDPPRTGARAAVGAIAASRARRVAYISCDPATLARDLSVLTKGGFDLLAIETFEMFPHTSHIEVLAALNRPKGRHGSFARSDPWATTATATATATATTTTTRRSRSR